MRTLQALTLSFVLASTASAGVILVDSAGPPGAYKNIQVAVNNAVDGDVILIAPGTYAGPVEITAKSLSLVVDGGDAVVPRIRVRNLAVGQQVTLRGLSGYGQKSFLFPNGPWEEGLLIENCAGRVVVEDAEFTGTGASGVPTGGRPGVVVFNSVSVDVTRCSIKGGAGLTSFYAGGSGYPGLSVMEADVSLHACQLEGGDGGYMEEADPADGGYGAAGGWVLSGRLVAAGCTFTGGDGGLPSCGVLGDCGNAGQGGDGVQVGSASTTAEYYELENTYDPGSGYYYPGATVEVDKQPGSTVTRLDGPLRELAAATPLREGESVELQFSGAPGSVAFLQASLESDWLLLPQFAGVLLTDFTVPGSFRVAVGTLDAGGALAMSIAVPDLGPGVEALRVHLQAAFAEADGARLGSGTVLILLDAAY